MVPVGDVWFATRYDDVSAILKNPERFRSDAREITGRPGPMEGRFNPKIMRAFARSMIFLDGLDHRRLRSLVTKAFTPKKVDELTQRIEGIVDDLLDRAEQQQTFDLMSGFALPLPLRIISELLGVERVIPMLGAANRDERAFDEPEVFDVGREPNRHLAFGAGHHLCLGAHLSRVEARIAFTVLLRRFSSMRLAVDRDRVRWNDSASLRGLASLPVALTP